MNKFSEVKTEHVYEDYRDIRIEELEAELKQANQRATAFEGEAALGRFEYGVLKDELQDVKQLVTFHEGNLEHALDYLESIPEEGIKSTTPLEVHKESIDDMNDIHEFLKEHMKNKGIPTQREVTALREETRHAAYFFRD